MSHKGVSTIRPESSFKLTALNRAPKKHKAKAKPSQAAGYTSMLTGKKGVMSAPSNIALTNSAARFRSKA